MKKLFALTLVLTLLFAFVAGCGDDKKSDKDKDKVKGIFNEDDTESDDKTIIDSDEDTEIDVESGLESEITNPGGAVATMPYSKGRVEGGYYINNWANIKFPVTSAWPQADESVYKSMENSANDVGFMSQNTVTGKQFGVTFTNLSGQSAIVSATDYLSLLETTTKQSFTSKGLTCTSTQSATTIAGSSYFTTEISVNNGAVYTLYACRKEGDYIITILATAQDKAIINSALSSITTAK